MSIAFYGEPQAYTPADNPITWVFESDQFFQENFSFLVQVLVNGTLDSEHLIFPEINGKRAHFDASEIARRNCSPPGLNSVDISYDAGNTVEIAIRVYERYGTEPENHAYVQGGITAFKACLHDEDFVTYNMQDYYWVWPIMHPRTDKPRFMTLFPRAQSMKCGMTQELFLMWMATEIELDLFVTLYRADGTTISTDAIATTTLSNKMTMLNVSPRSIYSNSLITEADFEDCAYYTVYLSDYTPGRESETIRITIDQTCDKYGTKRLHFLNSLGGIDAFSCTKANTHSREVEHNSQEHKWGQWDNDGNYVYSLNQARSVDHLNTSNGKLVVTTDWIGQRVQNWLADEIYESPYVAMEAAGANGIEFRRVRVTNNKFEYKQTVKETLFQEIIELAPSDNRKSALI